MTTRFDALGKWERRHITLRLRIAFVTASLLFFIFLAGVLPINLELLPDVATACLAFGRGVLFDATLESLLLGVIALLVSGLLAYWLAGRLLDPLRKISKQVTHINASSLDTRLALQGPSDEIKQLADAFDAMLDRLQEAFDQQSRFAASAAHALRTPLATMRVNLEVLREDPNASLEDYQTMSAILERNLTRVERSVADLLLLTHAEKDVERAEVALRPLLEDLLVLLTPFAHAHDVALHLTGEMDIAVQGDESLLARLFGNLIENGIFYNKPNGYVTITLRTEPAWAVITITDTGLGINPQDQPHIFEPFYRARDSGAQHREGVGLGLALVAHMIRLHGGKIQINSEPQRGTQFTIRLPLFDATELSHQERASSSAQFKSA